MTIGDMADKIRAIPTGGEDPWLNKEEDCINILYHCNKQLTLSTRLYSNGAASISIDWGDGTPEYVTSRTTTGRFSEDTGLRHIYAKNGDYLIKIRLLSGKVMTDSSIDSNNGGFISKAGPDYGAIESAAVTKSQRKIYTPANENLRLRNHIFYYIYCDELEIHTQLTGNISSFIAGYYGGDYVNIPNSPEVTSFGRDAFTQIYAWTFDFSEWTSIPQLSAAGNYVFVGTSYYKEIVVPDELYDDWVIATNWADIASYIKKKSESKYYGGSV